MNIYISNLNFATKDESLRNLFAGYGDVSSANIITDRETGRSRGFGFVEMPDETQGRSAIDAWGRTANPCAAGSGEIDVRSGKIAVRFFHLPVPIIFCE